jgi:hypothetical protein
MENKSAFIKKNEMTTPNEFGNEILGLKKNYTKKFDLLAKEYIAIVRDKIKEAVNDHVVYAETELPVNFDQVGISNKTMQVMIYGRIIVYLREAGFKDCKLIKGNGCTILRVKVLEDKELQNYSAYTKIVVSAMEAEKK